jgi:hypothetical protein
VNNVRVEPSGIHLSQVREQQGKEGMEFVYDVSISDVSKVALPGKIVIETDYLQRPRIEIPVTAAVLNTELAVEPGSFFFGNVGAGEKVARTVRIRERDGKPPKVLKIESGGMTIETVVKEEGGTVKIVATLDGSTLTGAQTGEIRVYTDSVTQSLLAIPVLAMRSR